MTLMEEFDPWLIPLTQRSGLRSKRTLRASFTQSAGVPLQLNSRTPPFFGSITTSLANRVLSTVMACPLPDWGLSGATTTTSAISFIQSIRALIPGAVIPSSLVTRMSGFFIGHTLGHKNTFFKKDTVLGRLTKN